MPVKPVELEKARTLYVPLINTVPNSPELNGYSFRDKNVKKDSLLKALYSKAFSLRVHSYSFATQRP